MERHFKGAYGILLTPFRESGNVDYDLLERQVEKACASPMKGIVVCGSTGEFTVLDKRENMELMSAVSEIVNRRKPLIYGATAGDYLTTVEYLKHMKLLGAEGALIAPPYYFPLSDNEVVEFYRRVSENAGGVAVAAYNIPQFTSRVSVAAFEKIVALDAVQGIKNSSGNFVEMMQYLRIRDEKRKEVSILTGSDELIFPTLAVGGDGNFTALTYLMPEAVHSIYEAFEARTNPLERQNSILELIQLAGSLQFPFGYKLLGEALGFDFGFSKQAISAETMEKAGLCREKMAKLLAGMKQGLK